MLRAGLRLADEAGIAALSMRKLARVLGVEAMSLYNHVASKDDLVDGIVELALAEIDLAPGEDDWRAGTRRRLLSAHEALSRHPWAASLWMSGGSGVGGARMCFADSVLRGLRQGGFSGDVTYHAFHVLQSHLTGYALYQQSIGFDAKEVRKMAADLLREFPVDDYPDLAEHVRQHVEPGEEHQGTFAFGLDLILDALERLRT